jgi:4-hydroxybenzoate polyprenyltransferase
MSDTISTTPDSEHRRFVAWLPAALRPFALLARLDRPIGWQLLYWPCAWAVLLAGGLASNWPLLLWFALGSIAMRGAGCVYNDIVDRDLDASVARTRSRPLPSGAVSLMKRITWWPQAWLGIVFSWGALVGWTAVTGRADPAMWLLYAGTVAWVIGYDTIYALQDVEDDALIGVRSSARRMGSRVRAGVALFYVFALALWGGAFWLIRPDPLALVALVPAAVHFCWQLATLNPADGGNALTRFRSNRMTGLLVALACLVVGL